MTLKVRRILSSIFILLFLAVTPAIVLYAAGFKLGKNGLSIQRTGTFILDSEPRGAKILINGKTQKTLVSSLFNKNDFITTPAKIKGLLPGEYNLSIELNGYWSWQKKLTIYPGASTFAEDIYLFKNDLPTQIIPAKTESINFSPEKNQAMIAANGQITFFNLTDEARKSVSQVNFKGKNIAWSADGQKILIDNYLYDLNNLNSPANLAKLASSTFNYKWANNSLFFQNKTSIYQLDSGNALKKIAENVQFDDYQVKDGYLYLINKSGLTADTLKVIDPASGEQIKSIALPGSADYSFINPEQSLINLYDNDHKILYLVDPFAAYSPLVEIINNVKTTFWVNSDTLLYAGDYEIWLYDLKTKNKTLITRISDTINSAIMHPSKNYIIYSTDKTINIIELDERQKRNITELVKADSIGSLVLSPKGDIIYFSGKIGNQEGLYKLLIQ